LTRRRLIGALAASVLAVAMCAAAALAVTGTFALPSRSQRAAAPATAFAAGAFTQSNSRDGAAILGASAMRPGDVVSGDVTITNTGDLAGAFHLASSIVTEQPGAGGGQLRDRLLLQILDVTNSGAATTLFSGPLGVFAGRDLGTFAPHEGRSYRVTATFPDSGPGADNAFAGASASVRFAWTATGDDPAPAPGPAPAPAPTTGPLSSSSVTTPGAVVTLSVAGGCVRPGGILRAKLAWKTQKRKGNVFVKVRRTDFFVGRKRVLLDRRAPFALRFKVPLSATAGSTLTVRARAFIKVRRGRSPTKSIRVTVKVCP
jgi:spore coat-associated protein N